MAGTFCRRCAVGIGDRKINLNSAIHSKSAPRVLSRLSDKIDLVFAAQIFVPWNHFNFFSEEKSKSHVSDIIPDKSSLAFLLT